MSPRLFLRTRLLRRTSQDPSPVRRQIAKESFAMKLEYWSTGVMSIYVITMNRKTNRKALVFLSTLIIIIVITMRFLLARRWDATRLSSLGEMLMHTGGLSTTIRFGNARWRAATRLSSLGEMLMRTGGLSTTMRFGNARWKAATRLSKGKRA